MNGNIVLMALKEARNFYAKQGFIPIMQLDDGAGMVKVIAKERDVL